MVLSVCFLTMSIRWDPRWDEPGAVLPVEALRPNTHTHTEYSQDILHTCTSPLNTHYIHEYEYVRACLRAGNISYSFHLNCCVFLLFGNKDIYIKRLIHCSFIKADSWFCGATLLMMESCKWVCKRMGVRLWCDPGHSSSKTCVKPWRVSEGHLNQQRNKCEEF